MQVKFKSGVSRLLTAAIIIYSIVVVLLLSATYFIDSYITLKTGLAMLAFELIFIIPMPFQTYYVFKEDYLLVHDYPLRKIEINYDNIFNVEDGDFKTKKKDMVALSRNRVALGYTKKNVVSGEEEERYVYVSPKDMSLFLIRLSAKLQKSKANLEEKAKEVSLKQKEHEIKKKIAEEKRKKAQKENEPEIIKAKGTKFGVIKTEKVENTADEESKDLDKSKEETTEDKE